ncbi:MAG: aminotransferase class I/II-fold pyridoxal phosphate-dependent enzyme [Microscillaceae bacterium]|nr:aminotransferase class I/II-fold pyridoxal phosphate-dependent enzyme [Microscillaceae bacterium]
MKQEIDLRSDTVTRPTPGMRAAMQEARVGDDVYEEDPSINALQDKLAQMFGLEAGLFCPSGTMSNQIGIKALTQAQDEVICYEGAHIYKYEGGGLFFISGVSVQLLPGNRGRLEASQIDRYIQPDNVHYPRTRVVALENTVNRAGGAVYSLADIAPIAALCQERGLKMHLDGARIFNALQATGEAATEYGAHFDTISVCLSKGLGCPVGSVLLGRAETIRYAKRIRKALGGGMRQAGFLAAAGLYALAHHIERLAEDHRRARIIGEDLAACAFVEEILPVETNIVISGWPPRSFSKVGAILP